MIVSVVVAGLGGGLAASAASAQTFTYTGGEQTYAVPANVTGLHVVEVGAPGLSTGSDISTVPGGVGAKLTADVGVPSGASTLYVEVGGVGGYDPSSPSSAGGFNGGGGGADGGGGASDIRSVSCPSSCAGGGSSASLGSRLAVAGGGGGASNTTAGGNAGNSDGSGRGGDSIVSGTGATVSAAGHGIDTGTMSQYCRDLGDSNGQPGSAGGLGVGGAGFTFLIEGTPDSGGGGGGLYGGGGGGQCYDSSGTTATSNAGGGGGGSTGAPNGSNATITTDGTDPPEVIITAPVPTDTTAPSISGNLSIGDVLTDEHGSWSSSPAVNGYTYQWERCNAGGAACAPIAGATNQAYTLTTADLSDTLRVQEAAINFYGPGSASTSGSTGVVGEPPTLKVAPTISGTATQGQVLDESHAVWTDGPITGYAYQWERCTGITCTPIVGAITQAYTLTTTDVGATVEVQEIATNSYGTSAAASSAPTAVVRAAVPPTVTISGPTKATAGEVADFRAAVSDSQGTPSSYRWTIGSDVVGTASSLDHTFKSAGSETLALTVTDTAGNSFTTSVTVSVAPTPPLGSITSTMNWSFDPTAKGVRVLLLTVEKAPVGGSIVVICRGAGCPSRQTKKIVAPPCPKAKKKCKAVTRVNVALASRFHGRHLSAKATLSVRIIRPKFVGKVYVFSMHHPNSPAIACLAPGATKPGQGCRAT
jgi:hypothetical protein